MKKHTARIDNWFKAGNCLFGNVTEHTLREFNADSLQRTSDLVRMNERDRTAETQNTHYTLGVKATEPLL